MHRAQLLSATCLIIVLFVAHHTVGQEAYQPDSVVLISELQTVDSLVYWEDVPYSGEAFFLSSDGYTPIVMRSYVKGKREGIWRTWHENGRLYKQGETLNGEEHGRYLEYHENGLLKYEYWYDQGKKTGLWRSWYESGDIYTERNFLNDKLHGRLLHYSEEGEILMTEQYKNGKLIATTRNK